VYNSASTLTGSVTTADRTITLPFPAPVQIFVDTTANDRLYAVWGNRGFIVNSASAANDPVTVTSITALATGNPIQLSAIAVKP
jgi:hypothetical protein